MWSRSINRLQVDTSALEGVIQKLLLREYLHLWVDHRRHGDAIITLGITQIVID